MPALTMSALTTKTGFVAALPHLDIHTLSEDWVLAAAVESHWRLLGQSLGLVPSRWFDNDGDRMYAGVVALKLTFDLAAPVREDDRVDMETRLTAIRKPHAVSETLFAVGGQTRVRISVLTSFIKRKTQGSNKKFSKVRGLWQAEDFAAEAVGAWDEEHHAMKGTPPGPLILQHEVNRITDFNAADFMYFKSFVRIAKAAEYRATRGGPVRLNATRSCWFYGNVDDGQQIQACVTLDRDTACTVLTAEDGRLLFVSQSDYPVCRPASGDQSGAA
jgi:probable biosynthetic protein (TIGR04098 family)